MEALDYAAWTVWQAELTVLDAIDARARADERAAGPEPAERAPGARNGRARARGTAGVSRACLPRDS